MEVKVYGSAHCVTSLKAKQWLEHHQLPYQFVDLEERDLSTEEAEELCSFEDKQNSYLRLGLRLFTTLRLTFPV